MKKIIRFFYILFLFPLSFQLVSCSSSDDDNPVPPRPEVPEVRRTVLVYIVGTNNLGDYRLDNDDITEMLRGSRNGAIPDDARWLVYHASHYYSNPMLFEVKDGQKVELKEYADGTSVSVSRMKEVFDDMASFAPAQSYGLILWSHGSGWIVDGIEEDEPLIPYDYQPLSFGNDDKLKMNISSLRSAMYGRGFDYVYFDCCHMMGVEVAYELRDVTDYLVGGPAETPGTGMPYDLNMAFLCDGSPASLIDAARTTFDEYYTSKDCIMSVISVKGIERLAEATRNIYSLTELPHPGDYVTNYYGTTRSGNYIDFGEYVNALAESAALDPQEFNDALADVVLYQDALDRFYSDQLKRSLPIYTSSGLSTYVFETPDGFVRNGYDSLQWAIDVVKFHIHD